MFTMISLSTLVITTVINAFGVKLLSILNNLGVGTEILGMFVFAVILLFFVNHQPLERPDTTGGRGVRTNGNYVAAVRLGMFMSLFVVYGFDTAGTFGEETVDAGRQAPRGVLTAMLLSGVIGAIFLVGDHPRDPRHPGRDGRGPGRRLPDRDTIRRVKQSYMGGSPWARSTWS